MGGAGQPCPSAGGADVLTGHQACFSRCSSFSRGYVNVLEQRDNILHFSGQLFMTCAARQSRLHICQM